ncbi:dehydrogenase FPY6 isoform X2 [Physcomitrium patens]|uniref:Gfo/Idh/MocA-like oxidoreductase N-terminal domain-containing protein n=2 Tax=Physcomitrium patens TaxID=3218 RepID=A0A2K1KGY3_PHYPA|nr:uncharacterized protein YMR315W-like [Physcomitrium patens]XP_024378013.1 uncharacterized protein YMR315W-like [Physcomitrium patens]XP_024378014.1 uncharacterized protein YMR315W-like [Physcomitrium patens]PNR53040.1 hypothetical protein PHYPA_009415 [Physcomitrium patens]|eukprot:XP_024378012.1 uncharacterized protein YMR315W-like [Physcomitrella patens]
MADGIPGLALLGSGIFASSQYIPKLGELGGIVSLNTIWSRSEDGAKKALQLAKSYAPNAEAKWGQEGLESILQDKSIHAVAVVLPAQHQLEIVLRALEAGKHVIQEKPVGPSVADVRSAWSAYQALAKNDTKLPIWAVAENYRFEPALIQAGKFVKELGQIMGVQVLIEAPMNSSSPYFSSSWRREANFKGGFMLDGGVHFIAGLRMIMGCEVDSVSATVSHVDLTLPPPDNLSALIQLQNGTAGVVYICYSAKSRKMIWRVVGSLGTVEVDRTVQNGQHGYKTTYQPAKGEIQEVFCPFAGVYEELRAFSEDVARCVFQGQSGEEADKRSSVLEAMRDVAVIEAMFHSSDSKGAPSVVELELE